jgi:iron complex transport system substrate-binding protein
VPVHLVLAALIAVHRIVTLMPSLADDAVAIGAGRELIGVSRFTTDIPQARSLPVVADFQSVDVERIIELHPDVVVGIPAQARLVAPLQRAGIRVVLLDDDSYDDIFSDLRAMGALTGHVAQAAGTIASLQRQTAQLQARAAQWRYHPRVFVALGTGPIWTAGAGSYLEHLIELAGGRNAASDLGTPWGQYSAEALLRSQPDVILADRDTNVGAALDREPWRSLRAVREGHVLVVRDRAIDDALFRPGPNYIEGLRWLIQRLSSLLTPTTPIGRSNPNS